MNNGIESVATADTETPNGHAFGVSLTPLQIHSEAANPQVPTREAEPQPSQRRRLLGRWSEAERLRRWHGKQQALRSVDRPDLQNTSPAPRMRDVKRINRAARQAQRARQDAEAEAMVTKARVEAERIRHEATVEKVRHDDELWSMRAKSDADRATDLNARIAGWKRKQTWSRRTLDALTLIGVVWGSLNVRSNIAADLPLLDPRQLLALALEPLLMIPLLLNLQAHTERTRGVEYVGRSRPLRAAMVWGIEVAALSAIVYINVFPHVGKAVGDLLIWTVPPVMVVVAVLLKPALVGHYNALIEAVRPMDTGRLDGDAANVLQVMTDIEVGLLRGEFQRLDEDGLPTINHARDVLGVRKAHVAQAIDGLRAKRRRIAEIRQDQRESATNHEHIR